MNRNTPYYYLRAVTLLPKIHGMMNCLREKEYYTVGPEGTFKCIEKRSFLLMYDQWEACVKKEIVNSPRGLFLDVGANIGRLSVYAGQLGFSVVALEPHPKAFRALEENLLRNHIDGKAYNVAAWNGYKSLPFYTGNSSALSNVFGTKDVYGGELKRTAWVMAVPVDSFKLSPSVVKIDAEGAEVEIMQGMGETMERSHPKVIFESFVKDRLDGCKAVLRSHGYKLGRLDGTNYVAV